MTVQQPSAEPAGTDSEAAEPPWVLPLTDISASRLAEVGGKALHLAELLRGGFRVPPGFCLTTSAYERATDHGVAAPTAGGARGHPRQRRHRAQPSVPRPSRAWCGRPRSRTRSRRPSRRRTRRMGAGRRGGGALVGHRRGPAVRQLRRPAGHLPQRGRRGGRAGRRPALLGVAVDRPRGRLPGQPAASTTARSGSPSWCSGWSTPRWPACCSPPTRSPAGAAAGRHRRQPRARRGGGVRRGQPRPLRGRHRQRRRSWSGGSGDKRLAIRSRARRRHRARRGAARARTGSCLTDAQLRDAGRARRPRRAALRRAAGHRVGHRRRRHAVADPVPADHHALPAARPARHRRDGARVYFCFSVAQGLNRPITPMGLAAFRLLASSVAARCSACPVADRRAGPPMYAEAGQRLFVDLTGAAPQPGGTRPDAEGARRHGGPVGGDPAGPARGTRPEPSPSARGVPSCAACCGCRPRTACPRRCSRRSSARRRPTGGSCGPSGPAARLAPPLRTAGSAGPAGAGADRAARPVEQLLATEVAPLVPRIMPGAAAGFAAARPRRAAAAGRTPRAREVAGVLRGPAAQRHHRDGPGAVAAGATHPGRRRGRAVAAGAGPDRAGRCAAGPARCRRRCSTA